MEEYLKCKDLTLFFSIFQAWMRITFALEIAQDLYLYIISTQASSSLNYHIDVPTRQYDAALSHVIAGKDDKLLMMSMH